MSYKLEDLLKKKDELPFVNREDLFDLVEEFIYPDDEEEGELSYVLSFYGVDGIGKTRFKKELVKFYKLPDVEIIQIDFRNNMLLELHTCLFRFRLLLGKHASIKFPNFDLAYALFFRKKFSQYALENKVSSLEKGSLAGEIVAALGSTVSPLLYLPKALIMFWNGFGKVKAWIEEKKDVFQRFNEREEFEMEKFLPAFLAEDIAESGQTDLKIIFIIDSFDHHKMDTGNWFQEMIHNLDLPTKNIKWIILSRNQLNWERESKDWRDKICVKEEEIQYLSEEDTKNLLREIDIPSDLVDTIWQKSNGYPFYIHLVNEIYVKEENRSKSPDLTPNPEDLIRQLIGRIKTDEKEVFLLLATPRKWNDEIWSDLKDQFLPSLKEEIYRDLINQVYIDQDEDGYYRLHSLIRELLQKNIDNNELKDRYRFLAQYYEKLADITVIDTNIDYENDDKAIKATRIFNPKSFQPSHIDAYLEAFYYRSHSLPPLELYGWFWDIKIPHEIVGSWTIFVVAEIIARLRAEIPKISDVIKKIEYLVVVLRCTHILAIFEEKIGLLADAKRSFHDAYDIANKILNNADYESAWISDRISEVVLPIKIDLINELAVILTDVGEFDRAEKHHLQAINEAEKTFGNNSRKAAEFRNIYGHHLETLGRDNEAINQYRQSLNIIRTLDDNDPLIGVISGNLGAMFLKKGQLPEAERLLKKAFELNLDSRAKHNYSIVLSYLGKLSAAETLLREVLAKNKREFGEKHPETARVYNSLANILFRYKETEKRAEAKELYKKAYVIIAKSHDPRHPITWSFLNNYINFLISEQEYDHLAPLIQKSVDIADNSPRDRPVTIKRLSELVGFYEQLNQKKGTAFLINLLDNETIKRLRELADSFDQENEAISFYILDNETSRSLIEELTPIEKYSLAELHDPSFLDKSKNRRTHAKRSRAKRSRAKEKDINKVLRMNISKDQKVHKLLKMNVPKKRIVSLLDIELNRVNSIEKRFNHHWNSSV